MEEIELRNPFWLKLLVWLVAPTMFLGSIYIILIPIVFNRYELIAFVFSISLGGYCLYMMSHILKTLPFMNAGITISNDGIVVSSKKKASNLDWKSISKVKYITSASVLHVYDSQGQRFLSVSENIRGFSDLVDFINKNSSFNV